MSRDASRDRPCSGIVRGLLLTLASLITTPTLAESPKEELPKASALLSKGSAEYQRGRFEDAVRLWKEAGEVFRDHQRPLSESRALGLLGQGYQALGHTQKAIQVFELAMELARSGGSREWRTELLGKVGALYLDRGQLDAADQYLTQALDVAREENLERVVATVLNDLGRWHARQQHFEDAVKAFSESAVLAKVQGQRSLEVRAVLNNAVGLIQLQRFNDADKWRTLAEAILRDLPDSHEKSMGLISYGLLTAELRASLPDAADPLLLASASAFQKAAWLADSLGDQRAGSYAWGYLARLYELERRYDEALQLSRQAARLAQVVDAPESLVRWQWQTGRVLTARGHLDQAIESYRQALYTLQPLRPELAAASEQPITALDPPTHQVYLELADLLLRRATLTEPTSAAEAYLAEAREVVELQKVAELRDYYRDQCVDALEAHATRLDAVSPTTAVLYPIVFADRTEILLSLPSGLKRQAISVTRAELTQEIRTFRRLLERRTTHEYLPHAQQLYSWLIAPLKADLASHRIDTLVIVPDAALRTIPLSALHDGREFLIKTYAVATTPGLNLTDSRPIDREGIRLLAGGLTQSVRGFPPLPDVATEVENLRDLYGGEQLIDQRFLVPNLQNGLKEVPYTVVHLASHGKFEADVKNTYLVTYDGRLNMDRLAQIVGLLRFRKEPLELLTLSACETAAGDDSAALGLAGVAIKAGAKSALATLWYINDQSSANLVTEFYSQLQRGAGSKAVALQRAQWKLLDDPIFQHPAYWSPFLLLNNWQ